MTNEKRDKSQELEATKHYLRHVLLVNTHPDKKLILALSEEDKDRLRTLPLDDFLSLYSDLLEQESVKKRTYFSEMSPIAFDRHGFNLLIEHVLQVETLTPEQQTKIDRLCQLMVRNRLKGGNLLELKTRISRNKDILPTLLFSSFTKALEGFENEKYDLIGRDALNQIPTIPPEQLPPKTRSINLALSKLSTHTNEAHGLVHGTFADQIAQLNALVLTGVDTTSGHVNTAQLRTEAANASFGLGGGEYGPLDQGYFLLIGGKKKIFNRDGVALVVVADELPNVMFSSLKNDYKDIVPMIRASELTDEALERYTS
jgi:hypothetical protein